MAIFLRMVNSDTGGVGLCTQEQFDNLYEERGWVLSPSEGDSPVSVRTTIPAPSFVDSEVVGTANTLLSALGFDLHVGSSPVVVECVVPEVTIEGDPEGLPEGRVIQGRLSAALTDGSEGLHIASAPFLALVPTGSAGTAVLAGPLHLRALMDLPEGEYTGGVALTFQLDGVTFSLTVPSPSETDGGGGLKLTNPAWLAVRPQAVA